MLRGDEEDSSGALNAKCYPSVLIFVSSTIGACYLQIAINWLEVAGKFMHRFFNSNMEYHCQNLRPPFKHFTF